MPSGHVCFLLHAHLPFVRHPEYEDFLEERWLFEAITETYLPLVRMAEGWDRDRLKPRLALSFSPTLLAMLGDDLLRSRYRRVLDAQIRYATDAEARAGSATPQGRAIAASRVALEAARTTWTEWGGNLLTAFRWMIAAGFVEPWTTAATHPLLPLWRRHPGLIDLQVRTGVEAFRRALGMSPRGFWLPECGYVPELEQYLAPHGIETFLLETHGFLMARPEPRHGVHEPVQCPKGIAVFGRDPETSRQVWSRTEGYPGDPWYREFHRDLGFERPLDELADVIVNGTIRCATGVKPHRVTGSGDKQPYDPARAAERVAEHARHYADTQARRLDALAETMDRTPVIAAPYDAELFGHWWFEGVNFLDRTIRRMLEAGTVAVTGLADYARAYGPFPEARPAASTWGEFGHHLVWIHESNAWVWPHLERLAHRFEQALASHAEPDPLRRRMLNQAARDLLAAQASDWPFMIQQGTTVDYAEQRLKAHLQRATFLLDRLDSGAIDSDLLDDLEELTPLFPWLDVTG